jgi:hypothetical protein
MPSKSEQLAYWFFRLNGFLTITNLVIHTERYYQGTEIDVIGIRFPFRKELRHQTPEGHEDFMKDYNDFDIGKTLLIIADAKGGQRDFNEAWKKEENIIRILNFVGIVEDPEKYIEPLYSTGKYEGDNLCIRFCLISRQKYEKSQLFPESLKITWEEITDFIYDRFDKYERVKRSHHQWDETGHLLWKLFKASKDKKEFHKLVYGIFISQTQKDLRWTL